MDNLMKKLPWDVKAAVDKVKNAVLNYTEMEAKVRDATNNDPWGAASTLLQEIARGTNHYHHFNEIMPMVYRRFAEDRKVWRQVYKTLQLVEYLLKNGSDRVIENVRDHIYEIKSLMNYQFVDEKGKDQGINVRHRAKEIVELIDDPDRLKAERDKALQNRNKYAGVSSDEARTGFGSSKFAAQASAKASPTGYDGYPGGAGSSSTAYSAPPRRTSETRVSASALPAVVMAAEPVVAAAPAAAPQPNLLDFDFGAQQQAAAPAASGWGAFESSAPAATASTGFGNFASFQAPPSVAAQQQNAFAAPTAAGFTSFQQPQQAAPADAFGGFASFQAAAPVPAPVAAPAANDFGDFGGFASSAPAPTVNTTAAAAPPGWNTAPLSATTTARPSVVAASPHAPKKVEDVLNSNLAALDSLAKFNLPTPKANGPALNQLGSTTAAPAAINTAASNNFGGFTVASAGSANAGFGNFASTGPMSAANVPGGFGAFQSGPGFGAQQQQQQTGSTAGQQAANPWGSVQNNDLLM